MLDWIYSSLKQIPHLDVFDIFLEIKENLSKPDFELFLIRTWATWNERLRYLHKCNGKDRDLDADWCENLLREYRGARASVMRGSEPPLTSSPRTWLAPLVHQFRLDVDAAYKESSPSCAVGGVIRNHEGQPILAFGELLDKPQFVTMAELLAIPVGIKHARQHPDSSNHLELSFRSVSSHKTRRGS